MKLEPKPAIQMEKQCGRTGKLGEVESLGISKAGQTVLARLMEPQMWYQLASSVPGELRKRTIASAVLDDRCFSSSLYATGAFQATIPMLELRGNKSEEVSLCVGSLRGAVWGSRSFFHQLNPCWFL